MLNEDIFSVLLAISKKLVQQVVELVGCGSKFTQKKMDDFVPRNDQPFWVSNDILF